MRYPVFVTKRIWKPSVSVVFLKKSFQLEMVDPDCCLHLLLHLKAVIWMLRKDCMNIFMIVFVLFSNEFNSILSHNNSRYFIVMVSWCGEYSPGTFGPSLIVALLCNSAHFNSCFTAQAEFSPIYLDSFRTASEQKGKLWRMTSILCAVLKL